MRPMMLAQRLHLPAGTAGILFDMDGVLLDTLSGEYDLVNEILRAENISVVPDKSDVRRHFALPIPEFWRMILAGLGVEFDSESLDRIVKMHVEVRRTLSFAPHEGVREIVLAAEEAGLRLAVVSNNPAEEIRRMLDRAGLSLGIVVGNDSGSLRSKPAPDMYLEGARRVGLSPGVCVAVEDSLIGAKAASEAGCHVIGVATGANDYTELRNSQNVHQVYRQFSLIES